MARPKKQIDARQVDKLASIQCSVQEMAAVLGCDRRTLQRRFATAIKKGRRKGRMSLKRIQYKLAMSGNPTMLIWLGKQHLGQSDKRELTGAKGGPIETTTTDLTKLSTDDLQHLRDIRAKMNQPSAN